jgi:hypothetical protein
MFYSVVARCDYIVGNLANPPLFYGAGVLSGTIVLLVSLLRRFE